MGAAAVLMLIGKKSAHNQNVDTDENPTHDQSCSKDRAQGIQVSEVSQNISPTNSAGGLADLESRKDSKKQPQGKLALLSPRKDNPPDSAMRKSGIMAFGGPLEPGETNPVRTQAAKKERDHQHWYRENSLHIKRVSNDRDGTQDEDRKPGLADQLQSASGKTFFGEEA